MLMQAHETRVQEMSLKHQFAALLASSLTLVLLITTGELKANDPPNIILIVADDLGYGDLGCYGQKNIKTPRIDQLAQSGMRFTDFYSGSTVCAPSRCSLMTGYHTGKCLIKGNGLQGLRDDDVTIAEILSDAGYATGCFGKWGLGEEDSDGAPYYQGFDEFYGYLNQRHAHNYYPTFLYENEERVELRNQVPDEDEFGAGKSSNKEQYSHDLIMDKALDFIKRNSDDPFFLYLPLTIPHANNEAKREGMEVPDYGRYADLDWPEPQKGHAAMITLMDSDVGRVVDLLAELEIRENTLVIFTSDNGPHSEGGNKSEFNNSNGPLRGMKRSLFDGGIRVPMIANWPERIEKGDQSNHISAFWDLLPTLAEIAGEPIVHADNLDGISFVDELVGQSHKQRQHDYLYWAFFEKGHGRAIRQGRWKLIQQPRHSEPRLYDLDRDIGEIHDVSDKHSELVRELINEMNKAFVPSHEWRFPTDEEWIEEQALKKRKRR